MLSCSRLKPNSLHNSVSHHPLLKIRAMSHLYLPTHTVMSSLIFSNAAHLNTGYIFLISHLLKPMASPVKAMISSAFCFSDPLRSSVFPGGRVQIHFHFFAALPMRSSSSMITGACAACAIIPAFELVKWRSAHRAIRHSIRNHDLHTVRAT